MASFIRFVRQLWRHKIHPADDPSPVDAIVRLLRETKDRKSR